MALTLGNTITATGNGNSSSLMLPRGEHALIFNCGSWGSSTATLKVGLNGSFSTALQGTEEVVISENSTVIVAGGLEYYIVVANYSAAITVQSSGS